MAARSAGTVALALGLLLAAGAGGRTSGPTLTAQPTVSGVAEVGSRLVAGSGTWTSASTISYAYQWYRCDASGGRCSSIHGATAPGLTLGARDAGKTIGLTVTGNDAAGSTPAYASLVGPIARAKPLLVSTVQPQVAGLPVEGKTLQVTTGAWSPEPTDLTYSWRRCNANGRLCSTIAGANASAYTVAASDVGHALVALVEAKFGATMQAALSTATPAALGADVAGPSHTVAACRARPRSAGGAAERHRSASGRASARSSTRTSGIAVTTQAAHCSAIRGATRPRTAPSRPTRARRSASRFARPTTTGTASRVLEPRRPRRGRAPGCRLDRPRRPSQARPRPGSTLTADAGGWRPRPHALLLRVAALQRERADLRADRRRDESVVRRHDAPTSVMRSSPSSAHSAGRRRRLRTARASPPVT